MDEKLLCVIEGFCEYKRHRGLSYKTCESSGKEILNISRLSKKSILCWDKRECIKVYYAIDKLPINLSSNVQLAGLYGEELLKKAETLGVKRIKLATVEKYLRRLKEFFDWLVLNGLAKENHFSIFKPPKSKEKKCKSRCAYREEHINEIVKSEVFLSKKNNYHWIIMIAVEMGLRQNEICQLYKDDIIYKDGLWCIEVTGKRHDQRVKNVNSERIIPIPKSLLRLGFIHFVEESEQRLFSSLNYYKEDGYSRKVSKWFSNYKKRWSWGGEYSFHSFRHYFINNLKVSGIEESITAEIVGHEYQKETYGRYGKEYSLREKKRVLDKHGSLSLRWLARKALIKRVLFNSKVPY
ncbi:site-specific integrase [Vibrio parahaemolyticus]|uniref:site-specific integrase n=1 Tax=Vibrio parahaemolyticus TaxID=670 RepID=UPI001239D806|nr:site-specific integrase [Vibrio parahaemolyticus]QET61112.1 site-specific integrase [Vibrio parahaemolyticus]